MTPFVIYALPRSRTFWLSRFLSYGGWECGHDQLRYMRSMEDVQGWFRQPNTGTVETAGAPWWRIPTALGVRTIVVRRPVPEVLDSIMRLHLGQDASAVERVLRQEDRKLDQIERRVPGVVSVSFDELGTEEGCARIFEACLPFQHDPLWWSELSPVNLQINMLAMVRYYHAHYPQLERLAKAARHHILSGMARKPVANTDGMMIEEEPFETFFADGQRLFAEHLVQVGEAPDNYWRKNLDLMRALDASGAMQIVTARSNGRMFGYLMTILNPSLEHGEKVGVHTTFYASSDVRGLGMKMQRVALQRLMDKGIPEAFAVAGVRGDGPRMGTIYRRLGAASAGELFRFDLKRAA